MLPDAHPSDVIAVTRRLDALYERVAQACQRAGRRAEEITLVGVTKTFPLGTIAAAIAAGLKDLGENKAQELEHKASVTPPEACRWHMIGHLQRNKARIAVQRAHLFHALDSLRLADRLDRLAREQGAVLPCLVQVNVSEEITKFGLKPPEIKSTLEALQLRDHLDVKGLMTLASPAADPETVRPQFRQMHRLLETSPMPGMSILSMGMSGDFEVAIEEGATHIRVGSAIFGARGR